MSFSVDDSTARKSTHSEDAIPRIDTSVVLAVRAEEDAHVGVKKVEAAEKVYGRYSKWFLFIR